MRKNWGAFAENCGASGANGGAFAASAFAWTAACRLLPCALFAMGAFAACLFDVPCLDGTIAGLSLIISLMIIQASFHAYRRHRAQLIF